MAVGIFSNRLIYILDILKDHLAHLKANHNQVYINLFLLPAKFVIWIHLLLIFLFEVQKSFKLFSTQCLFYDTCIKHLSAFILWTFDNEVIWWPIFFYVTTHAFIAKEMTTFFIKVVDWCHIADIANYLWEYNWIFTNRLLLNIYCFSLLWVQLKSFTI